MTNAVIYARFSTDMQSDASIEDQIHSCERRMKTDGAKVIQNYTDHAISGASLMRPGIQMLLQDAALGKFEVVYAEALDRLSRNQADIATVFERLTFSGVRIITLAEGEISELHVGLKGTMNALFLKDLAQKTKRGLRGRVEQGKSGGGNCYGYSIIPGEERGGRAISEEEAIIVRRIFEDYAVGKSPKAIAAALNKEGVDGPRGKAWGQSTINGNRHRGTGILNNELYIGRLIWNRLRYIKDPETGKRISRLNPEEEWVIQDVPELRIVDQDLWDRVKHRQSKLKKQANGFWGQQRPRKLFSGLLKCGECGGGYSMVSQAQLGCSTSRNKGTCSNRRTIKRETLEQDILKALKAHLMDPALCELFCDAYTKHMNKLRMEHNASLASHRAEHERIKRKLSQMVDAIADGAPVAPIKDKMHALEDRRVELESILEDVEEAPPLLHPHMAKRYHEQVGNLIEALNSTEHRTEATEVVRSLIEKVVLTPDESEDRLLVDLHGDLAGILTISAERELLSGLDGTALERHKETMGLPKEAQSSDVPDEQDELVAGMRNRLDLPSRYVMQDKLVAGARNPRDLHVSPKSKDKLVAGAGFEPATFRL